MEFSSNKRHPSNDIYYTQIMGKSIIKSQDDEIILSRENPNHELNILSDCQQCYSRFKHAVTLSCGFTLCSCCIPNKSEFQCMSFGCLRVHESRGIKLNITLNDILNADSLDQMQQLLQCSVCLQPFHEPITTECGHTFCKECLIRIMTDLQSRACPICRFELSRIGKTCQVLVAWIQFIFEKSERVSSTTDYIPIIQSKTVVTFPTQHVVFHINQHNNQSLLKHMLQNPYHHHYALCLFYSKETGHYYDYGIMVKINHVEYSSDLQYSVIQAFGLFRLRVHQLLQDGDNTYVSHVTRLEDIPTMHRSMSSPTRYINVTKAVSAPSNNKPMSMARPCAMKLSHSVPENTMHHYHHRKAWTSAMQFHTSPMTPMSPSTSTAASFLDDLKLKQELGLKVQAYLRKQHKPDLLMKYECYTEQDVEFIWWLCTVLPFQQIDKVYLFGLRSLRERIVTLIDYLDRKL